MVLWWLRNLIGRNCKHSRKRRRLRRALGGGRAHRLEVKQLEDRLVPSAFLVHSPAVHLAAAHRLVAVPDHVVVRAADQAGPLQSASPVGLLPSQIRRAYGIDEIMFNNRTVAGDGSGQTIAIVDAFDDPNIANDLSQFDSILGLPAPPSFTKVAQDGSNNYPGVDPTGGWEAEETLDVEWAHAVAPGANILLVEANNDFLNNLDTAVDFARNRPGVVVVSMSYGLSEFASETSLDPLFTTPAGHAGVTFVSATGDNGAPSEYQAYSPHVLATGGTTLKIDASNNYVSESGWSGSGGGISLYEAQPAYQQGVVTQSTTQRTNPDVAFDADPNSGVAIYDSYNNGSSTPWVEVGGTSLAAPSWAGLIAIADQGRALANLGPLDGPTQTLPALYQLPASDFHDITTGNNGFAAGKGYDLVTGLGSPIAYLLVQDLVQTPSIDTWTGAGPDANWSDPLNWSGDRAPQPGATLVFGPGASQLTNTDDFAAGTTFSSIRFTSSGYTINGNDIALTDNIDSTSATVKNTLNLNVALGGNVAINAGSDATTLSLAGNINTAGYNVFIGGEGGSLALGGVISGAGGLIGNSGTLVLSGANTFSGGTIWNGGMLELGNASALGTGMLTLDGGTIEASGSAVSVVNPVSLSGNITIAGTLNLTFSGATTLTGNAIITVSNKGITTFSGNLGESGGSQSLTEVGTGILVLSGSNTYSGGTILSAGTLVVGNNNALGTGTLTLDGGTIKASGGPISLTNVVTLGGNFTVGGTLAIAFSGTATLTGSRTITVNNSGLTTFSGAIGQSGGTWSLTEVGSGALLLSATNTYAGGTILKGGTLEVGNDSALGTGTLTLDGGTIKASGGPISLTNVVTLGGNFTVGGTLAIAFSGAATLTGSRTITFNNSGLTTFSGTIGQSGGTWSLTEVGSGALLLSAANTYAGGTILKGGMLEVGNDSALGTGTLTLDGGTIKASGGPISLTNVVTLGGNFTVGGTLAIAFSGAATLTGSRTITVSYSGLTTFSGAIGQSGGTWSLTEVGSGALLLSAANTYAGGTILKGGTLEAGNNSALGTGTLTLAGGTIEASGGPISLTNVVTLGGNFTVGGTLAITFSGTATLTGSRTITVNNSGLTTFSGAIGQSGGTWSLTEVGSGALLLSAANAYAGGTILKGGTLEVGNNSALGTGTLTLDGGTIEASGGPISLTNVVTLGGNFTVGGSLAITFSGATTLTGSFTITVGNSGLTTFSGAIGQSGGTWSLTKAGTGVLVLSAANTYSGGTKINGGTLQVDGSVSSGTVTVNSGGILAGSGTVGPVTVSAGGAVSPGTNSTVTGILSTGNVSLSSTSSFNVTLNGTTPGVGYDQLNVSGTVNLGKSTLNLMVDFSPAVGSSFTILNNDGTELISGTFNNLPEGSLIVTNGMTFQISYFGGTGNDVVLTRIS